MNMSAMTVPYVFGGFPAESLNELCCAPVAHLCDVPLCGYVEVSPAWDAGGSYQVRGAPTSATLVNGVYVPNCMPFPIPTICCADPVPSP